MSQVTVQISKEQLVALDRAAETAGTTRDGLALQYVVAGLETAKTAKTAKAKAAGKEES